MKLGSTSYTEGIQFPSRTYRVDDDRQFLVRVFLDRGLAPPRHGEDAPATTAKAAVAAPKDVGTC
jgi:hypothetical protein